MWVYLLNQDEVSILQSHNKNGAQVSPCDYGKGICIEEDTLNLPYMSGHKAALEAIKPLSERTKTYICDLTEAEILEMTVAELDELGELMEVELSGLKADKQAQILGALNLG